MSIWSLDFFFHYLQNLILNDCFMLKLNLMNVWAIGFRRNLISRFLGIFEAWLENTETEVLEWYFCLFALRGLSLNLLFSKLDFNDCFFYFKLFVADKWLLIFLGSGSLQMTSLYGFVYLNGLMFYLFSVCRILIFFFVFISWVKKLKNFYFLV